MEIKNILTFLKVAELKSFTKAAEKLGYSQSAITIQIQQLEKELETQLFERVGRGIALTEQGRTFIFHANEIIRSTKRAIESTKSTSDKKNETITGTLRIGSVESISTSVLPDILLSYNNLYPEVEIVVTTAGSEYHIDLVRNNTIDLFFTLEKKINFPGMKRTVFSEEEIIFVASPSITSSLDKIVNLEDLVEMSFLLTEQGASYRDELDRLLADRDLEIKPILEIGNTETIINLVKKNMGVSFLPLFSAKDSINSGTLVEIKTTIPAINVTTQMFYHKNKWITPQMEAFLFVAEDFFKTKHTRH
ncbi:LysR family transcriptional regulator [Paenibacillus sp. NPDC056933]|uniref:LysR family transcriptional regulator n=1 Tax=Paenibacillus sp. NPDC056933 TaxID=3345968 RepID=UPI0036391234